MKRKAVPIFLLVLATLMLGGQSSPGMSLRETHPSWRQPEELPMAADPSSDANADSAGAGAEVPAEHATLGWAADPAHPPPASDVVVKTKANRTARAAKGLPAYPKVV